jgi:hypothetical protein
MGKYRIDDYQVIEQNGKSGLAGSHGIILEPIYTSLVVTNRDKPLPDQQRQKLEDNPDVDDVAETNYPIVIADAKQGLLNSGRLISELKYDQIFKLTFCDYLCREAATWSLFSVSGELVLLAEMVGGAELSLERLLRFLTEHYPDAYDHLAQNLHKDPDTGQYISAYRRYGGSEFFLFENRSYDFHFFVESTDRFIVHNDFQVTYFDTVDASGHRVSETEA